MCFIRRTEFYLRLYSCIIYMCTSLRRFVIVCECLVDSFVFLLLARAYCHWWQGCTKCCIRVVFVLLLVFHFCDTTVYKSFINSFIFFSYYIVEINRFVLFIGAYSCLLLVCVELMQILVVGFLCLQCPLNFKIRRICYITHFLRCTLFEIIFTGK